MKDLFKNLFLFSIIPLLIVCSIISYNVIVDPFGVIRGDMNRQVTEPNQHYLKTKFILENPDRYKSFLFGNSRVGYIEVGNLKNTIECYNMAYSKGVPKEHLDDIKLFLKSGVEIKKVIIGLDEISFLENAELHKNQALRRSYHNKLNPLVDYLLLKPSYAMYKVIKKAPNEKFFSYGLYNRIYRNGVSLRNKKDEYINNHKTFHRNDNEFIPMKWLKPNPEDISSTIDVLKQINDLCIDRNIELVFFINPLYIETYKLAIANGLFSFMEELSLISDFYDFSGINSLTMEKINYYEATHYRPKVGDFIAKELDSTKSPYYVSKDMSNAWLKAKRKEVQMAHTAN